MGNDIEDSKKCGGNRLIGTIIGGFLGIAILWIEYLIFLERSYYLRVTFIFFGVILLVWSSVVFRWPGAVQPGGVVLCIILFDTPANHIAYALSRMIDTAAGVVFAIIVNQLLHRDRIDKWFKREISDEK